MWFVRELVGIIFATSYTRHRAHPIRSFYSQHYTTLASIPARVQRGWKVNRLDMVHIRVMLFFPLCSVLLLTSRNSDISDCAWLSFLTNQPVFRIWKETSIIIEMIKIFFLNLSHSEILITICGILILMVPCFSKPDPWLVIEQSEFEVWRESLPDTTNRPIQNETIKCEFYKENSHKNSSPQSKKFFH